MSFIKDILDLGILISQTATHIERPLGELNRIQYHGPWYRTLVSSHIRTNAAVLDLGSHDPI